MKGGEEKEMKRINTCLECDNCIYIGEGDYICDDLHEIVIDDFGHPTANWMACKANSPTVATARESK